MKQVVMQVVHVRIKPGMENVWSKATYDRVENWLKNWTCSANFKACIEPTEEEALTHCQRTLRKNLVPSWLQSESKVFPWQFEFEVSEQEVVDGEFWMPSGLVWCHWHSIPETFPCGNEA